MVIAIEGRSKIGLCPKVGQLAVDGDNIIDLINRSNASRIPQRVPLREVEEILASWVKINVIVG